MSLMFAQMGLSLVQDIGAFGEASIDAKMARSRQAYQNTMSALSAANAYNTVTFNENQALKQSDITRQAQQIAALEQEGKADVASGAAGVSGNTSDLIVRDLEASAARANKVRLDQLSGQMIAYGQERKNIELSKIYNKDISVIPKPSAASAMLGIGTNLLSIYDSHQTPSETIAARLGGTNGVTVRS